MVLASLMGRKHPPTPDIPPESGPRADGPQDEAIVAAVYTGKYLVWQAGREWVCALRGKFRREGRPVVGDRVAIEAKEDGSGIITAVHARRTSLVRRSADRGRAGKIQTGQVLAANVDRLVIVSAVREPPFRPGLVERLLVAGVMAGLESLLCINKCDLVPEEEVEELAEVYRALEIPVIITSALQPHTLQPLREVLGSGTSVLVGHSGVGKTSLLNALVGGELSVGPVADSAKGLGRHTTSTARLVPLAEGGFVIDSPGVREFGLHGIAKADLARHYPDFRPFLGQCAFGDCLHRSEPNCAVSEAVEQEQLPIARYESYLTLLEELE